MKNISIYAEKIFENDKSGHGIDHINRVISISKRLWSYEGGDLNKIIAIGWLHETLDYKFVSENNQEKEKVLNLLMENFSKKESEEMLFEIENISYKGGFSFPLKTLEGKIIQDADRLDSIGAIGIARAFYYAGHFGEEMHNTTKVPQAFTMESEYKKYIKGVEGTTINHFYEKLLKVKKMMNTKSGMKEAKERDKYLKKFLERFLSEWV